MSRAPGPPAGSVERPLDEDGVLFLSFFPFPATIPVSMVVVIVDFVLFAFVLLFWILLHMLMIVIVRVFRIQSDAYIASQAGNREMGRE